MSSFELLELFGMSVEHDVAAKVCTINVEFAPEDGALAAAIREDERPEWKQMLAQAANELAVLRVVQAPGADGDEYGSRLFLPVAKLREHVEEEVARAERKRNGGLYSLWSVGGGELKSLSM